MKPPMNQEITAEVPILDDNGQPIKDRYGRPQTESINSKARVQFSSTWIRDQLGGEYEINLQIDLPPEFNPEVGTTVEYTTIDGMTRSGTIRGKDEAVNLAGNRVYYRTVYVE